MGVKPFDIRSIGRTGLINPEQLGYQDSLDIIREELHRTRRSFVKIGWYLKHIREKEMYREENYANIYELAADKFNLSQPTATRFMNICEQFSVGHDSPELDEKYIDFNMSQLFEMLPMNQEEMSQVTPDMTVAQIRDFKKKPKKEEIVSDSEDIPGQTSIQKDFREYMPDEYEDEKKEILELGKTAEIIDGEYREIPQKQEDADGQNGIEKKLSVYGLPITEYPEGSLIATEGCGHKYYCFSCAQDCGIRQKDRYCCEAPLGNPFPCTTMNVLGQLKEEMGNACQFINQEKAYHTKGTNAAAPCCKECQEVCGYRCRRSVEKLAKEQEESVQQELSPLKNTDQRKEWLRNYKTWGLWYRDENIDVNYYKYDFSDGSRLVVAEYPQRQGYWREDAEDEYYFHLLEKNKKGYGESRYDEKYMHNTDSETYLVEFLKKLQEKTVKNKKSAI